MGLRAQDCTGLRALGFGASIYAVEVLLQFLVQISFRDYPKHAGFTLLAVSASVPPFQASGLGEVRKVRFVLLHIDKMTQNTCLLAIKLNCHQRCSLVSNLKSPLQKDFGTRTLVLALRSSGSMRILGSRNTRPAINLAKHRAAAPVNSVNHKAAAI